MAYLYSVLDGGREFRAWDIAVNVYGLTWEKIVFFVRDVNVDDICSASWFVKNLNPVTVGYSRNSVEF